MATTEEMINWMKQQAEDWNRTGEKGLLDILDQAQEILLGEESQQRIAYRSDGKLPFIATTDNVFEYVLDQATTGLSFDINKVDMVLVRQNIVIDFDYNIWPDYQMPYETIIQNGITYLKYLNIASEEALEGGYPTLRFRVNPGTTTEQFYLFCYKKATKLVSEAIPLEVPAKYHQTYLMPVAMLLLESRQNGNFVENLEIIEKRYVRKFRFIMDKGAQGISYTISRQEA